MAVASGAATDSASQLQDDQIDNSDDGKHDEQPAEHQQVGPQQQHGESGGKETEDRHGQTQVERAVPITHCAATPRG
ncbi:hypothetical protein Daura_21935 [Dactylosporangium aurantiacum]|uniref:Uncharacterized protein n=1 Tax=Dactylosporangium aurantiacum TaxID=35754 RepID=A0A9Q9IMY6_9ACTN|nr:hypothetical protein [Dactylosporangium aurantiacum]MDG6110383.1 hypothetical protein [Dactylosporangium aurantiacum]UWZ58596.1 hypothetical protein Daura_21935 [Dactylosporangium aurantiacum]